MNEKACGRVGRDRFELIARRAADTILARTGKWSVCLEPDGHVTVEHPDHAIPDDVIGTWNQEMGDDLKDVIEGELRNDAAERQIKGEVVYRKRVWGRAARAAA